MIDDENRPENNAEQAEHTGQNDKREAQHPKRDRHVIGGRSEGADRRQGYNHDGDRTGQASGYCGLSDDKHADDGERTPDHLRQTDGGFAKNLHRHFHQKNFKHSRKRDPCASPGDGHGERRRKQLRIKGDDRDIKCREEQGKYQGDNPDLPDQSSDEEALRIIVDRLEELIERRRDDEREGGAFRKDGNSSG